MATGVQQNESNIVYLGSNPFEDPNFGQQLPVEVPTNGSQPLNEKEPLDGGRVTTQTGNNTASVEKDEEKISTENNAVIIEEENTELVESEDESTLGPKNNPRNSIVVAKERIEAKEEKKEVKAKAKEATNPDAEKKIKPLPTPSQKGQATNSTNPKLVSSDPSKTFHQAHDKKSSSGSNPNQNTVLEPLVRPVSSKGEKTKEQTPLTSNSGKVEETGAQSPKANGDGSKTPKTSNFGKVEETGAETPHIPDSNKRISHSQEPTQPVNVTQNVPQRNLWMLAAKIALITGAIIVTLAALCLSKQLPSSILGGVIGAGVLAAIGGILIIAGPFLLYAQYKRKQSTLV